MDLSSLGIEGVKAFLLLRLAGPLATHIGMQLPGLSDRAAANLWNVFNSAQKKLGDKIEEAGSVPPRVLRGAIEEGIFCEDRIAAEYLGGVLASSRGEGNRDDRGVVMNSLISRMSVYQLRTHYSLYHMFRDLFKGTWIRLEVHAEQMGTAAFEVPIEIYEAAMDFLDNEILIEDGKALPSIYEHTFYGLRREGLIKSFDFGRHSLIVRPTVLGAELFLWAHGYGMKPVRHILDPHLEFSIDDGVNIVFDNDVPPILDRDGSPLPNNFGYDTVSEHLCCYLREWPRPRL